MFQFSIQTDIFGVTHITHKFPWEVKGKIYAKCKEEGIPFTLEVIKRQIVYELVLSMIKSRNAQIHHNFRKDIRQINALNSLSTAINVLYAKNTTESFFTYLRDDIIYQLEILRHHKESRFKTWNDQLDWLINAAKNPRCCSNSDCNKQPVSK